MFKTPTSVVSQRVDPAATYEDVRQWWGSADEVATAARSAVESGAVCFVQLGGRKRVLVCAKIGMQVRQCSPRGTPGVALLMTYANHL